MDKAFFTQKILPHIIAILIFLTVTIIFFHPIIFEGESINQHDILQGAGANQEILEYWDETGKQALWTNSMFSGMPAFLIHMKWDDDVLWFIQKVASFNLPTAARETFLAMVCFYILLLTFSVRPYLAILGALAFGMNTYSLVSIEVGHMWKVRAISFMPLVLAGVNLTFQKKYILGFSLTSLAVALEINANHLQMTYYLFLVLLIYGISRLIWIVRQKEYAALAKIVVVLIFSGILGIACNIGSLWSTIEYSKYSTRGKSELTQNEVKSNKEGLDRDYAFRWSNGITEPFTLLIPNFKGGASNQDLGKNSELEEVMRRNNVPPAQIKQYIRSAPTYWGKQPGTAGPAYAGAILIFLMVIGVFIVDKKNKVWLIVAIILSIILSWGDNFSTFNYLMFDYFPGYNKFRSVTFALFIAFLCMPILGVLGVNALIDLSKKDKKKAINILFKSAAITAGLSLFFLIISGFLNYRGNVDTNLPDWFVNALRDDRKSMFQMDSFRSFFFISLSALVLFYFLKEKISKFYLYGGLILLVFLDLWFVDSRYLSSNNFTKNPKEQYFTPTEADQVILQDKDNYRVLNLIDPFNEAKTSYFHHSIGGYHGAKLKRYAELIEFQLSDDIQEAIKRLQAGNRDLSGLETLNMLNVKYLKAGDSKNAVIRNRNAFGNAWLVRKIEKVNSADEEIEKIGDTNLHNTAVINTKKFNIDGENIKSDSGSIKLIDYSPNVLEYQANVDDNAFAVFSEIYYPEGWRAFIDGIQTEIIQTDYVLRGLFIPKGNHKIEFIFNPKSYVLGNKIVAISCYVLIIMFIGSIIFTFVRKK